MPDSEGSHARAQSHEPCSRGHIGRRRGRGGRPRARAQDPAPESLAAPPDGTSQASLDAAASAPQHVALEAPREAAGARARPDRGRRAGGRGATNRGAPRLPAHRPFGGHLTSAAQSAAPSGSRLSAEAAEFVPGRPAVARRRVAPSEHAAVRAWGASSLTPGSRPLKAQAPRQPHVRPPKSAAADLGTRIHEDIANWNYECAICTDDVLRTSHVWSCTVCWTVVHLKCAKKWHNNQKQQEDARPLEGQTEFLWRCPGCNSKLATDPGSYHCWCGKEVNPPPTSTALPPHSCGQTCSKPRGTCPHPCPLQCHAGPCPPCSLMGPAQSCFCGKNTCSKLCRETDYEHGWGCQELCGDLLPCGEHTCPRPCHSGLCGECDIKVEARCYCGRVEKQMACCEQDEPRQSYATAQEAWFEATFDCEELCRRIFDCGIHECSMACHVQDELPSHCPFAPDTVTHCPCGKTPLDELLEHPRGSCNDEIPHCEKPCERLLACGHLCKAKCHVGDCGFCNEIMDISCRCGRTSSKSLCHQGDVQHPLCLRACQANLSCGRHKCGERCCTGEKKAAERQAAKRRNRSVVDASSVEPEHICIRTCGRPLKCSSHSCQQMCHRGPCLSCLEAIFHEISCDCGRTVLQPPQPCGTTAPECRFNCQRRPSCGHPPVEHNCHSDDVNCPKCPFLVEKWCCCGKEKLHSQPCHLQEAHCGRPCGKKLKCGYVAEGGYSLAMRAAELTALAPLGCTTAARCATALGSVKMRA